jgi:hypothetical protein
VLFCPWALFNGDIPTIILLLATLSDFLTVGFHARCTFAALPNPWAKIPVDEESAVIKAQSVDVGHAGRLCYSLKITLKRPLLTVNPPLPA